MPPSEDTACTFLPLGAILQSFPVGPSNHNIVLGFPSEAAYRAHNSPYFGETIGRVANRVSNARIEGLNGKSYQLEANEGKHSLHGGFKGWGKQVWEGPEEVQKGGKSGVAFRRVSPDGEGGYPGSVECTVWYWGGKEEEGKMRLEIEYEVKMVGGDKEEDEGVQETVVAVTNHSYFNLSPSPTIAGTSVTLPTTLHQAVDADSIPTGALTPFPNLQPHTPFTLGPTSPFIDHSFVLDPNPANIPLNTRALPLHPPLRFFHPDSKIHLEIATTEPAVQVYTGEGIDVPEVEGVPARGKRAGFAIEPQRYVDAVSREEWRGMVRLRRGEVWGARSVYTAWVGSE